MIIIRINSIVAALSLPHRPQSLAALAGVNTKTKKIFLSRNAKYFSCSISAADSLLVLVLVQKTKVSEIFTRLFVRRLELCFKDILKFPSLISETQIGENENVKDICHIAVV